MITLKKAARLSLAIAILIAACSTARSLAFAQALPAADRLSWSDEFGQKATRWDWAYNQGAGYKKLVQLPDAPTAVEIGITAAASSANYSDCSLHQKTAGYTTGIFEARLRTTDDNGITQPGQGSRGWGFWDGSGDAAWFWSASPESDPALTGLRAQVVRGNRLIFNQALPNIDMRQWHTYRVELLADSSNFFVDTVLVASINERPDKPQRVEMWIDNYRIRATSVGYTMDFLDVLQDEKMFIDWARYYELTSEFVINHSFEMDKNSNNLPDGWTGLHLVANDKRIASSSADGGYIFQVTPSSTTSSYKGLTQNLNQSGRLNDAWRISLWAKTAASSPPGTLRVRLKFTNASGSVLYASQTLAKNTQGGYQTFTPLAPQDYARVTLSLESSITQGNVYLDNVSIVRP